MRVGPGGMAFGSEALDSCSRIEGPAVWLTITVVENIPANYRAFSPGHPRDTTQT